jgi:hypothetical protein
MYIPEKCWNGFTILSCDEGRLVDMNGNLVHLWKGLLHHPNCVSYLGPNRPVGFHYAIGPESCLPRLSRSL